MDKVMEVAKTMNGGVELPANRIVSFCPSITETLIELGEVERIVGVSAYCTSFLRGAVKPVVGSYTDVNVNRLEKLRPDLILTMGPAQLKLSEKLRALGYHVFPLPLPATLYGILENLLRIGMIVGRRNKAHEIAIKLLDILWKLKRNFNKVKRPRVYFEIWLGEPYSIGGLAFTDNIIFFANGVNIFHNKRKDFFKPDLNEVASLNPDVIIFEFKRGKRRKASELIAERGWENINAFRFGRILEFWWPDFSIAHPGLSAFKSTYLLSKNFGEWLKGGGYAKDTLHNLLH